jgi:predicted acyl esterase
MRHALLLVVILSTLAAACVSPHEATKAGPASIKGAKAGVANSDWVPKDIKWDTSGKYAKVLVPGPYVALPVEHTSFASFDSTKMDAAVWRPDVPEGTKVPVILDVGPYYGDAIEKPLSYIAPAIIEGLLPHGFAYVQVAVRGTAGSGGCQELFGPKEQKDIDAAVTYYGTQPWSNGNVGLTGISYDGTTTWISAMFGNPHLKTIVPIAGLTSIYDHGVRNGTAWLFEPGLAANYWLFGFETNRRTTQDKAANAACPEFARGVAAALYATETGDRKGVGPVDGYWQDRDFKPKILQNYKGSVFLVTGLLDWRVPPYLAFPFMQELQAKGLETKMLLGQWWHDMPDNAQRRDSVRWDYTEMLLHWFQRYLYENPLVNTGPAVDVEDDTGAWRTESNWPPPDGAWTTFHLGQGTIKNDKTTAGDQVLFGPASAHRLVLDNAPASRGQSPVPLVEYRATTGALAKDLRFAGMPRMHVTFVPTSPEGTRIYAELRDRDPGGKESYVATAVMDLRYYEGGFTPHTLTPGSPILAKMEFLPVDARIPAGHELVLVVSGAGYSSERITRGNGKSTLQLPLLERNVGDGKYPGQP